MAGRILSLVLGAAMLLLVPLTGQDGDVSDPRALDAAGESPRGIHLSYTGDPRTSMTVTWFTDALAPSLVDYGPDANLGNVTSGASALVQPAGQNVWVHETTLEGLAPGTAYTYRVGSAAGWSAVHTFRTTPADMPDLRFAVIGDHGTDRPGEPPALWQSARTTNAIVAAAPDLFLLAGDLSYANGDQPIWDRYFDQVEPLAANVPFMPAIGNHELEDGAGTQAFRSRFALPGAELYYSFDQAGVHFLVLQSHADAIVADGILADMVAFAEADLADADLRRENGELRFIVVMQHHPPWSNHEDPGRRVDPALVVLEEQWMARYGVDVWITGHQHFYERSRPMRYGVPTDLGSDSYVDPLGTVLVITGGGGQSLYSFASETLFWPWSAAHAKRYHYVLFEVQGTTLTGTAVDTGLGGGEVFDVFSITRTGAPMTLAALPLS